MFRLTTIFLCALFLAAVAGRYSAEESVSAAQETLQSLEAEYMDEMRRMQTLRAEVAYLESPDRLAKVARATTNLRPPEVGAILSAQQFRTAMLSGATAPVPIAPLNDSNKESEPVRIVQLVND